MLYLFNVLAVFKLFFIDLKMNNRVFKSGNMYNVLKINLEAKYPH